MPAIRANFSEEYSRSIKLHLFRPNYSAYATFFGYFNYFPITLHGFSCIATTSSPRRPPLPQGLQVCIFATLVRDACRWICPTGWFCCPLSTCTAILSTPAAFSTFPSPPSSTPVILTEPVPKRNIPDICCNSSLPIIQSAKVFTCLFLCSPHHPP